MALTCPECGNQQGSRFMGHEIQGVYDGVLFWVCMECGVAFARDFGDWDRLNTKSREHVDRYNGNTFLGSTS